jgi:hypothetical protein
MTEIDALRVLRIMLNADNSCADCVSELFCDFTAAYPEFRRQAQFVFANRFGREIANFVQRVEARRVVETTSDNGTL